jgi:hypothetical protein
VNASTVAPRIALDIASWMEPEHHLRQRQAWNHQPSKVPSDRAAGIFVALQHALAVFFRPERKHGVEKGVLKKPPHAARKLGETFGILPNVQVEVHYRCAWFGLTRRGIDAGELISQA